MDINFETINNFSVVPNPTSLDFGPDGRLYVTAQTGQVIAYELALENGQVVVLSEETLTIGNTNLGLVQSISNHNDDGSLFTGYDDVTVNSGENAFTNRQVTGIITAGTADNPVLYISSSDPRIAVNGDVNLDTNSGIITRATLNDQGEWEVVDIIRGLPRSEENHSVNGLQFDEATNTLYVQVGGNTNNGAPSSFFSFTPEYSLSGTLLEIDLTAIEALEAQGTNTDPNGGRIAASGANNNSNSLTFVSREFVYDLPTLDDPNRPNDGTFEDANGLDVNGPFGGNDGFNQAILAPDSPVRIFADGQRNPFDLVLRSSDGRLFSVDNGGNGGLGGNPNESNGEPVNTPNGGGDTDDEPLLLLSEGSNAGHPVPVRANPDGPGIIFNDAGEVNQDPSTFTAAQQAVVDALGLATIDPSDTDALAVALTTAIVPDLSALVPASLGIEPGFLIDPSRFAAAPGQNLDDLTPQEQADRLAESGDRVDRSAGEGGNFAPIAGTDAATNDINALAFFDNTTNGITEYFGAAFGNAINGALITVSSNGNVTLLNVNADGTGLDPIIVNGEVVDQDGIVVISPGGLGFQLDVTTGPVGSPFEGLVFSGGFGPDNITVLAPSDQPIPGDPDLDNDGLFETNDPFTRDGSNGALATISADQTLVLDFDNNQDGNLLGPDGFGSGLTGIAINGVFNPEEVLFGDPDDPTDAGLIGNVRIGTAAGGGVVNIVNVEQGTSAGTANDQQLLFQSGFRVTPGVETFTARWVVGNPGLDLPDDATGENNGFVSGANQEIGGFLGTGDQSNILRVVATHAGGSSGNSGAGFIVEFENNDIIQSTQFISAADLFDNVNEIDNVFETITIEILVDRTNGTATPTITYVNGGTTDSTTLVGDAVDISGSNLEAAINNEFLLTADQGPDEISGIAVGLFSSNGDAAPADAFSAIFDEVTIDTTGVPITVIHRVNFGGPEVAALDGGPAFTADTNANPSPFRVLDNMASNASVDTFGVTPGSTVSPTVPEEIFSVGRFDLANAGSPGELTYEFPNLEDGTYQVTVFLGNGFGGASNAGDRIFDISLEGSVPTTFEDIDPVALFGNNTGGQLSTFVEVTDGTLNVEFLHQVENPNPFGIEVALVGQAPDVPLSVSLNPDSVVVEEGDTDTTANFTFELNQVAAQDVIIDYEVTQGSASGEIDFDTGTFFNGDTGSFIGLQATILAGQTSVTVPVTIIGDDLAETAETFTVNITGASSGGEMVNVGTAIATATITDDDSTIVPGDVILAINAGGGAISATIDGEVIDFGANTGGNPNMGGTSVTQNGVTGTFIDGNAFTDGAGGNGPQDFSEAQDGSETIFDTERFGGGTGTDGALSFEATDLAPGQYFVQLFFAEIFQSAAGARVFDVEVEGELVLDDFDILSETGGDINGTIAQIFGPITVSADGVLNIELDPSIDNAKISALVLREATIEPNGDTTAPVVTVALAEPVVDDGDFVATLTFDEPVTGLESSEVTLSGPNGLSRADGVVDLAANGLSATVTFASPIQGFENGDYSAAVADGAVSDAANNTSAAASSPVVALALALDANEVHDENVNGDLSDDNLNPTDLAAFTLGSNIVTLSAADANGDDGTGLVADRDYFTFEVPDGLELSTIELANFVVADTNNLAFLAIAEGDNVDFSIDDVVNGQAPTPNNLLGAALIGDPNEGGDILALLGSNTLGAGSGFDGPLGPGTYTIWYNQNLDVSRASLDLQLTEVVIVPPTVETGPVLLAINAGGPAITETINGESIDFGANTGNGGGTDVVQDSITGDFLNGNAFGNQAGTSIFDTERFGGVNNGQFNFEASGFTLGQLVSVELLLAEGFQMAAGARVFDVSIEDQLIIDDIDLFDQAGFGGQVIQRFGPIEVGADGIIDVDFSASVDNASVRGIIIREETDGRVVINVESPAPVEEMGDTGDTILTFPITFSEAPLLPVTVEVEINNNGVISTQTVDLGTTGGSVEVAVPNDDEFNGDEAVTVTITSVTEGDAFARLPFNGSSGTSAVTEDEISPLDIDDDGVLNTDDPFAFDNSNGLDNVLSLGGEINQDFNTDTTDPFSAEGGFTGILVNPAFDPPGASGDDPYGDRTLEDGVNISNGVLSIVSSNEDAFQGPGNIGPNNTLRDAYQSAVDVSGVQSFEIVSEATNVFQNGNTGSFSQFGIQAGAGGVDDYVKLVVIVTGAGPSVQLADENSLTANGADVVIDPTVLSQATDVRFSIAVDQDADTVTGTVTFLDAAGDVLDSPIVISGPIDPAGSFAAALAGENPLTGGQGGLAYGVYVTDIGFGGDPGGEFTAEYDFLTIRSLDETTLSIVAPADINEGGDDPLVDDVLSFSLAAPNFSGVATITYSLDGGTTTVDADITFVDGAATLDIAVPQDDLANGDDLVTVTLIGSSVDALVIDTGNAEASATILEDDFAPVAVADSESVFEGGEITFNPAANDTDGDNLSTELTVTAIDDTATIGGTVTLNPDGTVTVVTDGDDATTGDIVFGYTVSDPGGNTAEGTATVTIAEDTLIAIAATAEATEAGDSDGSTTVDFAITSAPVAANAMVDITFNIDGGDPQNATITLDAAGAGTLSVDVSGFNDDLANGDETVTVTITDVATIGFDVDGTAASGDATILEDDFAPVAVADSESVFEGGEITFNPAANDTDGDNLSTELTVTAIDDTATIGGTVTLNPDGTVTVVTDGDDATTGDIVFGYTVSDPGGNTAEGTATVTIAEDTLIAIAATAEATEAGDSDGSTTVDFAITSAPVAANAMVDITFNIDGGDPQNATITLDAAGAGTLSVDVSGFNDDLANGDETVTVTITDVATIGFDVDGTAASGDATILEDDFAPVAVADSESVFEGGEITFNPAANDTDGDNLSTELTVTAIDDTATIGGTVTLNPDGTVTVVTDGDDATTGDIVFGYTVSDPGGNTAEGTATVTIAEDTLIAIAATAEATEAGDSDGSTTVDFAITSAPVATNAMVDITFNIDGGDPQNATITLDAAGAGTLSVDVSGFNDDLANGDETVTVTITDVATIGFDVDDTAASGDATILEDDFAPVATDDAIATEQDEPILIDVLGNDTDADLDGGMIEIDPASLTQPTVGGTVSLINGQVLFTPTDGFIGDATFSYVAVDSAGNASDPATVTVSVEEPPAPVRIQAEEFDELSGFFIENQGAAEGGQVIRLGASTNGTATLDLDAAGVSPGQSTFSVTFFDENDGVSSLTASINGVEIGTITLDQDGGAIAGEAQNLRSVTFTDVTVPDNAVLTLSGTSNAGEFVRIDAVEFVPIVDDGSDNQAPAFNGVIEPVELTQDVTFELNLNESFPGFTDPDEDVLTFETDNPLFTIENGVLTATPTNDDALAFADANTGGPFDVTVTAIDPSGAIAQTTFTVSNIINVNDAPILGDVAPLDLETGVAFSIDLNDLVSDADGDDVEISFDVNSLPAGLSFDQDLGIISGTPEIPGSFQIDLTIDDGQGADNSITTGDIVFNVTGAALVGDAVRIQAEDLALANGFFIENQGSADENQAIRTVAGTQGATASLTVGEGPAVNITPGDNNVAITFFDESDGVSTIQLQVNGVDVGTPIVFDQDGGGNAAQAQNLRTVTITGIALAIGDVVTIIGNADAGELLRIDYLEFTSGAGSVGNFAPIVIPTFEPDDAIEIIAGQSLDLNQVFADPEEDVLTFNVTDANGAPVDFLSIVGSELVVALDAPQEPIDIILTAVDAGGSNVTVDRALSLTVEEPIEIPPALITPIDDQITAEDTEFSLDVSSAFQATIDELSAPGGDDIVFSATLEDGSDLPAWLTIDPTTGVLLGTPLQEDVGVLSVTVTATDDDGSVSDTFMLTIENVNDAPVLADVAPVDLETGVAVNLDLNNFVSDEDGDDVEISFDVNSLPAGLSFDQDLGIISGTPEVPGSFQIFLTIDDGQGADNSITTGDIVFNVTGAPDLGEPIRIQAEDLALANGFFIENLGSADENQAIRTLPSTQGATASLTVGEGPAVNITPGDNNVAITFFDESDGVSTVQLQVNGVDVGTPIVFDQDGGGAAAQAQNLRTVTIAGIALAIGDVVTIIGDADAGELLRIDYLEFTPVAGPVGNFAPIVIPTFEPDDATEVAAGQSLDLNEVFDDPEDDVLTFNVTDANGAPVDFLSIVGSELVVAPDAPQEPIDIILTAVDADGSNVIVDRALSLTIEAPIEIPPALVTEIDDQIAAEDTEFSLDVSSAFQATIDELSAPGGDDIVFSATLEDGSDLPAWLTIDPATGVLLGTPLQEDIGVLSVTVTATDDDGSVSDTFMLTIENVNDAPIAVEPPVVVAATINEEIAAPLDVSTLFTDEDLLLVDTPEVLTFELLPANPTDPDAPTTGLPDGVTFDPTTGLFEGTPTETGSFTAAVTATDVSGEVATTIVSFDVMPVIPVATGAAATLTINTGATEINSSTFSANSIFITNTSTNDVVIDQITINLASGVIADTVFDPNTDPDTGLVLPPAGDAVNSDFTVDGGSSGVAPGDVTVSFNGARTPGFDEIQLDFAAGSFAAGDVVALSGDIDPLSAFSPGGGGAVSGQELTGATFTVMFSDGTTATGQVAPDGSGTFGATAEAIVGPVEAAPILTLGDGTTDARVVNQANLPISIDAGMENAGATVRVFILDTAYDTPNGAGTPANGQSLPAFGSNDSQAPATVLEFTLNNEGQLSTTVPVTRIDLGGLDDAQLGVNLISAVVLDDNGDPGVFSAPLRVEFDPDANVPPIIGGDPGEVLLRINAGGPTIAAIDGGPDFLGDVPGAAISFFSGTQDRGDVDTTPLTPDLTDVPNAIFETARSDNGPFSYTIPVAEIGGENGIYTVNLFFGEAFDPNNVPGARVFDVNLEGTTALDNFDVAAQFGGDGGVISTVVEVTDGVLNIDFINNGVDNAIVSAVEVIEGNPFGADPINTGTPPVGDPADALEILGVDDGVFDGIVQGEAVDNVNNGGDSGSVLLTVLDGVDGIQSSNFGTDSFQLINTGDKEVAAVFIDIRGAVFGDQVFDIDGTGGDTTASLFEVDGESGGGTGAFFVGADGVPGNNADNLFFAGPTPLPDTSGQAAGPASGGFRGLLLRFDGSEGGFDGGETVGFSGDGDPNSIAGFSSGLLNPNAVTAGNFDTGGQSGAELIGSSFTVLFADGTTATGFLGSDGTQAGAVGEAVQGRAPSSAQVAIATGTGTFSSNGDNTGTYGGDLPEITVTGTPGDEVRVTLFKGFNPTDLGGVTDIIQDRLDDSQPQFAVNNAFDIQTFDVTIGANGTAVLPDSAFDYNATDSGVTFTGDNVQPLAITAHVLASVGDATATSGGDDTAPAGPVSTPVFLTNPTGTPVDDSGVGPAEPNGFFQGIGSGADFRFRIQIEDPGGVGVQDVLIGNNDNFVFTESGGPNDNNTGEQGDGFFVFTNGNAAANNEVEQLGLTTNISIINNPNASGGDNLLSYRIFIPEEQVGETFLLRLRVARDEENFGNAARGPAAAGNDAGLPALLGTDASGNLIVLEDGGLAGDQQNDVRFNVVSVDDPNVDLRDLAGPRTSEDGVFDSTGFARIFGGPANGSFGFTSQSIADVTGNATFTFSQSGFYDVVIAGRSIGYNIDAIDISQVGNLAGLNASSSQFIEGDGMPDPGQPFTFLVEAGADDDQELTGALLSGDLESNQGIAVRLVIPSSITSEIPSIASAVLSGVNEDSGAAAPTFNIRIKSSTDDTLGLLDNIDPASDVGVTVSTTPSGPTAAGTRFEIGDIADAINALIAQNGALQAGDAINVIIDPTSERRDIEQGTLQLEITTDFEPLTANLNAAPAAASVQAASIPDPTTVDGSTDSLINIETISFDDDAFDLQ